MQQQFRLLFLLIFTATFAHAQSTRTNRSDENDSIESKDSIAFPRLIVKASVGPLLALFDTDMSADIGGEYGFRKRYSADITLGVVTKSPFTKNRNNNPSGYYAMLGLRRYFLKNNGFYVGLNFLTGQKSKSFTVHFISNGGYDKRSRVTRTYQILYPCVGWHGSVWYDNKYPIDVNVGPSFEWRKFGFKNLGPYEINEVMEGRYDGIEDIPELPFRIMIGFWLKVGIVVIR